MNPSLVKRLENLKSITLIFLLIGIALSFKLWLSNRYFPLVPLLNFIPSIAPPFDSILLFSFILSIILKLFMPQIKVSNWIFWICTIILIITDINRIQPWFYLYIIILGIFDFVTTETNKILITKILLASIYFYSGWHKLNPEYFNSVIDWFIQPFYSEKNFYYSILKFIGSIIPLIEMACSLLLLSGKFVKQTIITISLIHIFILTSTGPLGHNYNSVIWPWNIFMPLALYLIFCKAENENLFHQVKNQILEKTAKSYLILYVIFTPFLNSFNLWPSYMSWNLYSGNTENARMYLGEKVNTYFSPAFDNIIKDCYDAPYTINPKKWALKELNVPPFPEKPVWHKCHQYMQEFTGNSNEVILSIQPKTSILGKMDALTY
jgi:uncharacterized membrane protein YphA (DoxX/SURF4 family)